MFCVRVLSILVRMCALSCARLWCWREGRVPIRVFIPLCSQRRGAAAVFAMAAARHPLTASGLLRDGLRVGVLRAATDGAAAASARVATAAAARSRVQSARAERRAAARALDESRRLNEVRCGGGARAHGEWQAVMQRTKCRRDGIAATMPTR